MAMSKKDFIQLADFIAMHNKYPSSSDSPFTGAHLATLADFCRSQNSAFNRERWFGYINGQNGPSGGKVKA
jgi:hypothetical protein